MDLTNQIFYLSDDEQRKFVSRQMLKLVYIFGGILALGFTLLVATNAPGPVISSVLPMLILIFGLVIVLRWAFVTQFVKGFQLYFDEDYVSLTFDKNKVGTVAHGMSKFSEAKHGASHNQFIHYQKISHIRETKNGLSIYSRNYDFMTSNGRIDIPIYMADYEKIKTFLKEDFPSKFV